LQNETTSETLTEPVSLSGPDGLPLRREELPDPRRVRGWPLERLFLLTTMFLTVGVVGLMAVLSAVSTQRQFEETAAASDLQLQAQTAELGQTLSHTLALTSASPLRDNALGLLDEVVKSIIHQNKNVLRIQIFDGEGMPVADSDAEAPHTARPERRGSRPPSVGSYQGVPVFEYQEAVDYGAQVGKGAVVVSYSLEPLQRQKQALEDSKRAMLQRNNVRTALLGGGFVLVAVVLSVFLSRRITRPLGALTRKVMQLAKGDLRTRVPPAPGAGREVQALGIVFNHMADRINLLLEDVRNKAVLEHEMHLARKVQETLLPGGDALVVGAMRVAGACMTADECGGDWWLRAALDEQRVVLGIGDVTGHGLSTALVATSASSAFAAAMQMRPPEEINAQLLITSLNQILFRLGNGQYQMSSALAVLDLSAGEIDFAVGAHPAPCVYNRHDGKVSALTARGALLGASPLTQYQARRGQMRPGDVIVWYTDGLTECPDAQGRPYGAKGLAAALQQHGQLPVEHLRDAVIADVRQHMAGTVQSDDITLVIAEYGAA